MRQLIAALSIIWVLGIAPNSIADEQPKSVATAQPSVVKTVPQCGDTMVSSATKEIKVTFSKEMTDRSWSWCMADEGEFPEMVGEPKYLEDKRTCVLAVKLKPKTTYAIWLNTHRFINFKDKGRRPAVPYLLVFQTR